MQHFWPQLYVLRGSHSNCIHLRIWNRLPGHAVDAESWHIPYAFSLCKLMYRLTSISKNCVLHQTHNNQYPRLWLKSREGGEARQKLLSDLHIRAPAVVRCEQQLIQQGKMVNTKPLDLHIAAVKTFTKSNLGLTPGEFMR